MIWGPGRGSVRVYVCVCGGGGGGRGGGGEGGGEGVGGVDTWERDVCGNVMTIQAQLNITLSLGPSP